MQSITGQNNPEEQRTPVPTRRLVTQSQYLATRVTKIRSISKIRKSNCDKEEETCPAYKFKPGQKTKG